MKAVGKELNLCALYSCWVEVHLLSALTYNSMSDQETILVRIIDTFSVIQL